MQVAYTKEAILDVFNSTPLTEIRKSFTREQLADMFRCLYGERPTSRANKNDIINCISTLQIHARRYGAFGHLISW